MGFPNAVNPQAVRQVIRFITGQDSDKGRLALAAYEIEGYGLNLMFPGAAYIQDKGPSLGGSIDELTDPVVVALKNELTAAPKQGPIDWTKILEELKPIVGPILLKILTNILLK